MREMFRYINIIMEHFSRKQERKEAKRRMDYLANEFRFLFCERREREKNSFFEEGLKYGGYVT